MHVPIFPRYLEAKQLKIESFAY